MSIRTVISTLALAGALLSAGAADAQLYGLSFVGPDGPATLNTLDPATGVATPVGLVGFERCGGMDFNADGVLYATCERSDGSNTPVLVTIDLVSGAGSEVGPTGLSGSVGDLSFAADGTLYAFDASNDPDHSLFTVDTATGIATLVGDTGLSFAGGNGMTFDLEGTLFHSQFSGPPSPDLNTLDPMTGAPTLLGQIAGTTGRFGGMDVDPESGVIFASLNEGGGGAGPKFLATISPTMLTTTIIGATDGGLDPIAFFPAEQVLVTEVPTLGELGLGLLVLLLAGLGVWQITQRR